MTSTYVNGEEIPLDDTQSRPDEPNLRSADPDQYTTAQPPQEGKTQSTPVNLAKGGGIVVSLFAALWVLIGVLLIMLGGTHITLLGLGIGGPIATYGVLIIFLAFVELLAGIAAFQGGAVGRVISIVYAVVLGVAALLILVTVDNDFNRIALMAHAGGYTYAAFVLITKWQGRRTAPKQTESAP